MALMPTPLAALASARASGQGHRTRLLPRSAAWRGGRCPPKVNVVRVNHDGTNYTSDQTVNVPEQIAQFWLRSEWVTEAAPPKSVRRKTS